MDTVGVVSLYSNSLNQSQTGLTCHAEGVGFASMGEDLIVFSRTPIDCLSLIGCLHFTCQNSSLLAHLRDKSSLDNSPSLANQVVVFYGTSLRISLAESFCVYLKEDAHNGSLRLVETE